MASKGDFTLGDRRLSSLAGVSPEELKQQVGRIKKSQRFSAPKQLQILLDLLARRALSPDVMPITQSEIGLALGLHDFDPTKPTVRIAAGRLRSCLSEFYATEGRDDPIVIEFPRGRPYRLEARKKAGRILPRSDQAFQRFNEGRLLWAQRTPESLAKAVSCFQDAIGLDSNYADAHAALAECYLFMAIWGMAPKKVMPFAKQHAQLAVKINPLSAEAHATLGGILSGYDWNWDKAWKEFDRAIELDEHCVTAYCLRAAHFLSLGNAESAARDARLTQRMTSGSPSPLISSHVAKILYAAGQYEESEELLFGIREMMPGFYLVHWQLGLVLASKGDLSPALECIEMADKLSPESPSIIACQGWINALSGKTDVAKAIADRLAADRKRGYIPATDLAMIYGALGRMDLAFDWLNRACPERALFLSWLAVWPPLKCLYEDPRSAIILSKMNLNNPSLRRT